ncbi:ABC transporter [Clostridia bacterium]|nr:ABC transporter [Clostridia bacterium]
MASRDLVNQRRKTRLKHDLGAWLIMLPSIALFAFYIYIPLIESIRLSFFKTQGMTTTQFVWFENYRQMFLHPDFWPSVRNSLMYTVWSLIIGFLVPIVLALIINEMIIGKNFARTAIYLPVIVPGLATVVLWRFIFGAEASGGMNMLLAALGIKSQAYLSNSSIVIPIIVLTMTWRNAGSTALIYLAGLQSIDPEHYEAAIIDGAGVWSRVLHITIPNIFNLGRTLLILQIIAVFQILYEPLVMTNGGPNNASVSMMQVVYRYAFERFDYSHATAMSVIIAAILLLFTLLYNRVSKPNEAY